MGKCSRCGRLGHYAKDCKLPFARDLTVAETRMKREAEKALKMAEREAQQAEYEKKKAEYEKKKAAWMERQSTKPELPINKGAADKSAPREARLAKDWDARSDISLASTAASAAYTLTCEQELEVQAVVAKDKAVRDSKSSFARLRISSSLQTLMFCNRKKSIGSQSSSWSWKLFVVLQQPVRGTTCARVLTWTRWTEFFCGSQSMYRRRVPPRGQNLLRFFSHAMYSTTS